MKYFELYYTSSEEGIDSKRDGFGVRTYSEGFPKELLGTLKEYKVFAYESGKKSLVGAYDLIENPTLVYDYPPTFTYFNVILENKAYSVFCRTIFIGRDYGWYLPKQQETARSGNTFTHVLVFENFINASFFTPSFFQKTFIPKKWENSATNEELRTLLVGTPRLLKPKIYHSSPPLLKKMPHISTIICGFYHALSVQKRFVVVVENVKTIDYWCALIPFLPKFILRQLSIATNYQRFNLDSTYQVLFLNEYYPNQIPVNPPNLVIYDIIHSNFPINPKTNFTTALYHLLEQEEWETVKNLLERFDTIINTFSAKTQFETLFQTDLYFEGKTDQKNYELFQKLVLELITYDLKSSFWKKIEYRLQRNFENALRTENIGGIAILLQLIGTLQTQKETAIQTPFALSAQNRAFFTDFFFTANHATILLETLPTNFSLSFLYEEVLRIKETFLRKKFEVFIINNKFNSKATMNFFIDKFLKQLPDKKHEILVVSLANNKTGKNVLDSIKAEIGEAAYYDFLKAQNCFAILGTQKQKEFFERDTKIIIEKTYKKEGIQANLPFLQRLLDKENTYFFYVEYLAHLVLAKKKSYSDQEKLVAFYTTYQKNQPAFLDSEVIKKTIQKLSFHYFNHANFEGILKLFKPLIATNDTYLFVFENFISSIVKASFSYSALHCFLGFYLEMIGQNKTIKNNELFNELVERLFIDYHETVAIPPLRKQLAKLLKLKSSNQLKILSERNETFILFMESVFTNKDVSNYDQLTIPNFDRQRKDRDLYLSFLMQYTLHKQKSWENKPTKIGKMLAFFYKNFNTGYDNEPPILSFLYKEYFYTAFKKEQTILSDFSRHFVKWLWKESRADAKNREELQMNLVESMKFLRRKKSAIFDIVLDKLPQNANDLKNFLLKETEPWLSKMGKKIGNFFSKFSK